MHMVFSAYCVCYTALYAGYYTMYSVHCRPTMNDLDRTFISNETEENKSDFAFEKKRSFGEEVSKASSLF